MLEKDFNEVYTKFKLHFYRAVFARFQKREASLTTVETFCMEIIKVHYHTNEPWKVLEYCASLGEIYDIVVEDMERQAKGLQG